MSKLVIEYVMGLVAENVAVNSRMDELIQIINNADNSYCMCGDSMKSHSEIGGCGSPTRMFDHYYNAWLKAETETPATDAAIAEISAKAVEEFASSVGAEAEGLSPSSKEYKSIKSTVFRAVNFAANLRAGRKG